MLIQAGMLETSVARRPRFIDFSCGFQSARPSGTRSSAPRVPLLRVPGQREKISEFEVHEKSLRRHRSIAANPPDAFLRRSSRYPVGAQRMSRG
jgi:hypothetical protein